jgi:hypothetical protein
MNAPVCLYRRVIGAAFEKLPGEVQRFHSLQGRWTLDGRVTIFGPQTRIGALLCRILKLPAAAAETPMQFELSADPIREIWTRRFAGRPMMSTMSIAGGQLVESLGPLRMHFRLEASADRLVMHLERMHVGGVRCPRSLMAVIHAQETADPGRLHFDVQASLPMLGRIVHYRGYLDLSSMTSTP